MIRTDRSLDMTRLGCATTQPPVATVCIVDSDRIWFKASLGLDGVQEVSRAPGLGASVILDTEPYLVTHARTDPRTASHPFVTGEMGLQRR